MLHVQYVCFAKLVRSAHLLPLRATLYLVETYILLALALVGTVHHE
jgi:hypothetical protein